MDMGTRGEQADYCAELVRQAKKRNQSAFMELYSMYYKELYAYACYMLNHRQDAEDVVSDTIMAAYEDIGKLRDEYRFRQWLFKILSNKCRRRRKEYADNAKRMSRWGKGEDLQEDALFQVSDGRNLEKEVTDRAWVQQAFDTLSDEERYIVSSFLFGGYRGDEIAESLGIGSSTLRSKYRRALLKMKQVLES